MEGPYVGEKVKVLTRNKEIIGNIVEVYQPCEYHSGRFRVLMKCPHKFEENKEFWFSDYGNCVIHMNK